VAEKRRQQHEHCHLHEYVILTVVSHLVVVVGHCTDDPKDF